MPHAIDPPEPALAAFRRRLRAAGTSLEECRPPQLWGDETDQIRVLAWRDRCVAARDTAELAQFVPTDALPRGGGRATAGQHPHGPSRD